MDLGYHYYHSEHAGVYKRQMWVTLPWVCVINVCSNGGVKKLGLLEISGNPYIGYEIMPVKIIFI